MIKDKDKIKKDKIKIVDYIGFLVPPKDSYLNQEKVYEELKKIAIKRNCCIVTTKELIKGEVI